MRHHRDDASIRTPHTSNSGGAAIRVERVGVRNGTIVVNIAERNKPRVVDGLKVLRGGKFRAALAMGHDYRERRAGHIGEEDRVRGWVRYGDHGITSFKLLASVIH